jgi:MFS family permease
VSTRDTILRAPSLCPLRNFAQCGCRHRAATDRRRAQRHPDAVHLGRDGDAARGDRDHADLGQARRLLNKKTLVQIAIVIFVAGSLLSALAQNVTELIAARALQGVGVGGLQSLVQIVIAAMIPPRERGRYNGYLGAVMAVAIVAGPLLGGLIVDTPWLGWRWCFFIAVPIAVVAFVVLQKTLHVPTVKRPVKIDYLGATLIAAGVSILLIWVTFVDNSFGWLSWQSAAMVGAGVAVLAAAWFVEGRAAEPVVPLPIVKRRTTALAIVASLAVGMAMYGGAVFLGQYFQVGRGFSPTRAGLLTIPMMLGLLVASTVAGRLISRHGRIKPYIVAGTLTLVTGFVALSVIDHRTPLWYVAIGMLLVGVGVGMSMQNLILAVQNTVPLRDIGAASGALTFFRSLGGTIGVSVLGAVLAHRVTTDLTADLAAAGLPAPRPGEGATALNLAALPEAVRTIVQSAYGDATGHIFLISVAVGLVGVVAALLLPRMTLRGTLDLEEGAPQPRT